MDAVVFGKAKQVGDHVDLLKSEVDALTAKVDALQLQVSQTNKMLVLTTTTAAVLPGQMIPFDQAIDTGINKLLLKSIYVEGDAGTQIDLEIVSSTGDQAFLVYKNSVTSNVLYDVLDLPYVDDDNTNSLHFHLLNNGDTVKSTFRLRITGLTSQ